MSKSNYYKERVIQLLLFFAFMLPMGALAQNIQLNGTVTDVSGESVIGASVLEKGTTNGVITDIDGNFTLSVSPKATIIISYVGYAPQEIALNGRKELKVVLKEDTELLDEVVVIGYGTQKKSDVSGSVSSVSGDKLNNIPTANAETALQGMAPGLIGNWMSAMPKNLSTWQRWPVQTPVKTPKTGLLTLRLMSKTPHSLATPIGRTNTTATASHRNTMWGTLVAVRMPT